MGSRDVKNESTNGKLPVLFHIHGGAFNTGGGSFYGPYFFMDECVVHVTTNYRLGALGKAKLAVVSDYSKNSLTSIFKQYIPQFSGFLTTADGVIPGNLGLKDALLALKWINENVGFFRGDNTSITLNGVSAGGAAVSHFIASPAASGN